MKICSFPDRGRILAARGLCQSRYDQNRRGLPLRPVGRIMVEGRMTRPEVRVSDKTRAALGPHPHKQPRVALEAWTKLNPARKQAAPSTPEERAEMVKRLGWDPLADE